MTKRLSRVARKIRRALIEPLETRTLLSLVVDVRLVGGGKDFTVNSVGEVINVEVFATVTGDDADGSNEGLTILTGSFLSENVSGGAALGNMTYARVAPFNASGSSDGVQSDLDSDGDLDVGSNNNASATGFFVARANPTATAGTVNGASMEFKIATGTFTVASLLTGAETDIVFRPRNTATSFLYIKDGAAVNGTLGGTVAGGAPLKLHLPAPANGTVNGTKFNDLDGDGIKDVGEPGVAGVTINVDIGADGTVDDAVSTDSNGNYSFTAPPGTYRVREVQPTNSVRTTANPADITLAAGQNVTGVDFGNFTLITVSGQKFNDLDGDGVKDAGEPGVGGVAINVDTGADGSVDDALSTDSDGNYSFSAGPGVYRIREVPPAGSIQTTDNPSDITATSGQSVTNVDFGNFTLITVSGQKFDDLDGDGVRDAGEAGVANVVINIDTGADGTVDDAVSTDVNGNYSFAAGPGVYRVREEAPAGTVQTTTNPTDITATSGGTFSNIDFGNFTLITLSGQKFNDLDGDGVKDAGEAGLSGVTITLDEGGNGSIEATATTDSSGNYTFTHVGPGVYRVREVVPTGSIQTTLNPADISAVSGTNVSGIDFGNHVIPTPPPTGPAITGYKFDDLDGDGKWDTGEPGVSGVTINLDKDANGSVNATAVTNASGFYAFYGLTNNKKYRIREVQPAGTVRTTSNPVDITVKSNKTYANVNFGNFTLISIGGQKFNDANNNGLKDAGESGIQGVKITLDSGANGSVNATTYSDVNGNYSFIKLAPGVYRIREVVSAGSVQTTLNPADIRPTSGVNVTGIDFGNYTPPPPPPAEIDLFTDPCDAALTALRITSNDAGEKIEVLFIDQQGKARVIVNNTDRGVFEFTGSIVIYGNGGNDTVRIESTITRSAFLFGGFGDDYLSGGAGPDVLLGEAGNDSLYGNAGCDILIGGLDRDTLNGGDEEDIVIGGRTAYDASLTDLCKLTDEWRRTDKVFDDRVINIRSGGGLNGTTALSASNVFDDLVKDASSGGSAMDLFYSKYTGPSANQDDGPDYKSSYDKVFNV